MNESGTSEDQGDEKELEHLRLEVDRLWSPHAARALRLSEARYRALVEGSSDFIYVLDPEGRFTFANREAESLLGYRPEELIGRHFTELLRPEDLEGLGRAFHERRVGARATRRLEFRLRTKAGTALDVELDVRHFSLSASGLYRDQTFLGTHGVARDISEAKYQEMRLRALQVVRDAVWDMVGVGDIDRVLGAPRGALEIMRLPFARYGVQIVDQGDPPVVTLYTARDEGGVTRQADWIVTDTERYAEAVMALWRRGRPVHCRDLQTEPSHHQAAELTAWYGPARTVVDVPFSHGVLTVTGTRPAAFSQRDLGFFNDLAEILSHAFRRMDDLRQLTLSEKRYRTLVETPTLVVALLDVQGNFLYVSPQVRRWLGYDPEDFYRDAEIIRRIIHPEDLEQFHLFFAARDGQALRDLEYRWRGRSGDYRWASCSLFPIYEEPGDEQVNRISMYQMVIQDVTERKHVEDVVRDSLREKEVLLKEIHHRVKNNLQVISSLLHLQSADLKDESIRQIFSDSQHRIASMALIHEALYNSSDLARIDFAAYSQTLVQNLLDSFGISSAEIELELSIRSAPLTLDRAIPLGLIINELVSNSFKHAFPAGRRGRVAIGFEAPEGERFVLRVGDDGVGLPAAIDPERSPSLGLRLVQTLASQLRCRVELDRTAGTTFTFTRD
ncbi:MAG: PAS domain S-box protein [Candidatus Latescibacterota bacterium]|jgi:PAS domain S-box-containing protein